jgi:hypothetical protein
MIAMIILLMCLGVFVLVSNYYVIPVKDKIDTGNCHESYVISGKNRIDTQKGNECAAFSIAYILQHFGIEADGHENYKIFPRKLINGTIAPRGIIKFLNRNGFSACFYKKIGKSESAAE